MCADRMRLAPSLAEQRTKEEREKSRGGRSERNVGWLFFPPSLLSIITFILRCVWLESTAAHTPAPKQLTILLHFQAQEAAAAAAARKQQCPTQVSEETTPPPPHTTHHPSSSSTLNTQSTQGYEYGAQDPYAGGGGGGGGGAGGFLQGAGDYNAMGGGPQMMSPPGGKVRRLH